MTHKQLTTLLQELVALRKETEWVEFKQNYVEEVEIGEYISALSNSACLNDQKYGYLVYGVENETHKIVGTEFKPKLHKIGNQELENWLATQLEPPIDFNIYEFDYQGNYIALFQIDATKNRPVRFRHDEFIRVGSYKKKLKEHPEKERKIWTKFPASSFERKIALDGLSEVKALELIDYPSFFDLTGQPLPSDRSAIIDRLKEEDLLRVQNGKVSITNLGSILFAKRLKDFDRLQRKTVRVIIYDGKNKATTIKEQDGIKGYANGFEGLVAWINDQIPQNEIIEQALRKNVKNVS